MFWIIAVMFSGIVAGRLLRRMRWVRAVSFTTSATIVALLFLMGGEIGSNEAVMKGLSSLGAEALAIAAAAVAGSVVAARAVYAWFFERREGRR